MTPDQFPPIAKIVPHTFQHLGKTYSDNYAWLQNKADPQVIQYLEAENAYARATLQHTTGLQEQLYQEMFGRIKEDDSSAPFLRGEYFYYTRNQTGQQYHLFCRRRNAPDAPEEVMVDENILAEGKTYCQINICEPSPDHNLLLYSVDTTGALVFDLYIKDLRTGQVISGPISSTAWTAAWASDSRTVFYTIFDTSHRPYKLFRHIAGGNPTDDVLVYHEKDDAFNLLVERSRSGAYLLITLASASTSEVHYLPADQPDAQPKIICPRKHWVEYYVEHHGNRFLIRTNEDESGKRIENYRLVETPLVNPAKENWRTILPHDPDTYIESVIAFRDHLALFERHGGLRRIRISALDGLSNIHYIAFPDPAYTVRSDENPESDTISLRFFYSSLVTPASTIDYDMATHTWNVKKVQEIPSGYDRTQYTSERLYAAAPDGAQVPISLVYRKDFQRDGSHPLLLTGYGSYGFSSDPNFDARRLSLLDRGFAFAIAHIRGGSEMGRQWYENGRLMHKKNSFTDFIACAEHLITNNYTSAEHLAIMGGSAGGLLVSAVANMRPELFKSIVAMVPFTNVIEAMLSPDLPLTVIEYEQWGHPNEQQAFEYMLSYSPYENVSAKAYPHIYAKAGLNDLQVPYWDPAKWVAKLRAHKTDNNRLVLVTNMGAGHGGASGRYDHLREDAQVYAFLLDTLGHLD